MAGGGGGGRARAGAPASAGGGGAGEQGEEGGALAGGEVGLGRVDLEEDVAGGGLPAVGGLGAGDDAGGDLARGQGVAAGHVAGQEARGLVDGQLDFGQARGVGRVADDVVGSEVVA